MTETASQFFERNQAIFDKWDKYKKMTAAEYAEQFSDLIDFACTELADDESDKVLWDAFMLLKVRLGVRIESKLTFTPRRDL